MDSFYEDRSNRAIERGKGIEVSSSKEIISKIFVARLAVKEGREEEEGGARRQDRSSKWFSTRERERDCHMLRQRDPGKLVILIQV